MEEIMLDGMDWDNSSEFSSIQHALHAEFSESAEIELNERETPSFCQPSSPHSSATLKPAVLPAQSDTPSWHDISEDHGPIGLTLRKTESLLDLLNTGLSQAKFQTQASLPMKCVTKSSERPRNTYYSNHTSFKYERSVSYFGSSSWNGEEKYQKGAESQQHPAAMRSLVNEYNEYHEYLPVRRYHEEIASSSHAPYSHQGLAEGATYYGSGFDKLKASNFPATSIKIGKWELMSRYEGDLVAKCYYAKRKLVWEVLDGGLKSKVEIQWGDISSIRASTPRDVPGTLEIEVSRPPLYFRETNPQPRKHTQWEVTSDFTGGQAEQCGRHVLTFPEGTLNRHYEKLLQCDPRLRALVEGTVSVRHPPHLEANSTPSPPLRIYSPMQHDEVAAHYIGHEEKGSSPLPHHMSPVDAHHRHHGPLQDSTHAHVLPLHYSRSQNENIPQHHSVNRTLYGLAQPPSMQGPDHGCFKDHWDHQRDPFSSNIHCNTGMDICADVGLSSSYFDPLDLLLSDSPVPSPPSRGQQAPLRPGHSTSNHGLPFSSQGPYGFTPAPKLVDSVLREDRFFRDHPATQEGEMGMAYHGMELPPHPYPVQETYSLSYSSPGLYPTNPIHMQAHPPAHPYTLGGNGAAINAHNVSSQTRRMAAVRPEMLPPRNRGRPRIDAIPTGIPSSKAKSSHAKYTPAKRTFGVGPTSGRGREESYSAARVDIMWENQRLCKRALIA